MTYSYSLPVADPKTSLPARVEKAIADLPVGKGRDEATAHASAVVGAAVKLARCVPEPEGDPLPLVLSVSGHGDERTASVHVTVYRPFVATSPT
jgi:hypothetical protein